MRNAAVNAFWELFESLVILTRMDRDVVELWIEWIRWPWLLMKTRAGWIASYLIFLVGCCEVFKCQCIAFG